MGVKIRTENLNKSPLDDRSYRALELNNGMKVLLVHDLKADKGAASLSVATGSLNDPRELPGLAHFCEHMLFLGTKKYPCENDYGKFVQMHGGMTNAYTASDHTNYHFDCTPEHLKDALDRFAQFFHEPLFTESATEREVNAVDSENSNNLKSDMWRFNQLEHSLSRPEHDYSKFGTGNRETLWEIPRQQSIDTRTALLDFHNKWYSSNIMGLCIVGRESLDELEKEFVLPMFGAVENKNVTMKEWPDHPYTADQLGNRLKVVPIKDIRNLRIQFPIDDQRPHYRSQPSHYVSHLLGHEAAGSLLSELKRRGWASALSSGGNNTARGFGFFTIDLDLSEEGLKHVDEIIELAFEYIGLIRGDGIHEWIHNECRDLYQMEYKFQDKARESSMATSKASSLHEYKLEEILTGPYIMDEYRPDLINGLLDQLTPDRVNVMIVAQDFKDEVDQKEKWYGTEYKQEKIDKQLIERWKNASKDYKKLNHFHVPERNMFIAENFDLVKPEPAHHCHGEYNVPRLLVDSPLVRLWFQQDDEFKRPKTCVNVSIHAPVSSQSPLNKSLTNMLLLCINDSLTEYTYNPSLAGLNAHIDAALNGLHLAVSGYNDKLPNFTEYLLNHLKTYKVDAERFLVLKEYYVRSLRNHEQDQPYSRSVTDCDTILSERKWSFEQMLAVVDDLTIENTQHMLSQILARAHIELLVHGNETEQSARAMFDKVSAVFEDTRPLFSNEIARDREIVLQNDASYVFNRVQTTHANSAVQAVFQIGEETIESVARGELLVQMMQESAFDTLRTKEQLGYIVFSGQRIRAGSQSVRFIVQGGRHPKHVMARINEFLVKTRKDIESMSEQEFNEHKSALITKRLERPKKLRHLSSRHWSEIRNDSYLFDRAILETDEIKKVSKDEVLRFLDRYLMPGAKERSDLSIRVYSNEHAEDVDGQEQRVDDSKAERIDEIADFQSAMPIFRYSRPCIKVPPRGVPVTGALSDADKDKRARL